MYTQHTQNACTHEGIYKLTYQILYGMAMDVALKLGAVLTLHGMLQNYTSECS